MNIGKGTLFKKTKELASAAPFIILIVPNVTLY